MRTVKEVSDLTGISVRTLHYYDEIGLLKPAKKSEAGYRLYDDQALEMLQQILFFREFEIPLKEIKSVLNNPSLDRNQILEMQRNMLAIKKERLERLIASINQILKGENRMDFAIFNRVEIEKICEATMDHMPGFLQAQIIQEFGSVDQWKRHYRECAAKENLQRGYQKMVEWYGSKEDALNAFQNPPSQEVVKAFEKRVDAISQKLVEKRDQPLDSLAVKEIVGEYGFVMKQLYQVNDETEMMQCVAKLCRDPAVQKKQDEKYGAGASEFIAQAIEAFYLKSERQRSAKK